MRKAAIYNNEILAGLLTEHSKERYTFKYDKDYLINPASTDISLTLPKREEEYEHDTLFPFFFNMISEGINRSVQSKFLKIDEDDDFGFLIATAESDTVGKITVKKIR